MAAEERSCNSWYARRRPLNLDFADTRPGREITESAIQIQLSAMVNDSTEYGVRITEYISIREQSSSFALCTSHITDFAENGRLRRPVYHFKNVRPFQRPAVRIQRNIPAFQPQEGRNESFMRWVLVHKRSESNTTVQCSGWVRSCVAFKSYHKLIHFHQTKSRRWCSFL